MIGFGPLFIEFSGNKGRVEEEVQIKALPGWGVGERVRRAGNEGGREREGEGGSREGRVGETKLTCWRVMEKMRWLHGVRWEGVVWWEGEWEGEKD